MACADRGQITGDRAINQVLSPMDKLTRCREGLEKIRLMLTTEKLLTAEQMQQTVALLANCERDGSDHPHVVLELRSAHLKVTRCDVTGEYMDFLEAQYRARGLSAPRKIATLVVIEEATNALKRAMAATMEEMRRLDAA
jgi:hypothetical protein